MHRDRAWRRKKSRLYTLEHEQQDVRPVQPSLRLKGKAAHDRPRPAGKLTPTQAKRQDGLLATDMMEAWSTEPPIPNERPPDQIPPI
jgi:hypothetical protein